jgi:membrane dipeptidase
MPIIVDAHEDIAWNILTFGRDYSRAAADTRQLEAGNGSIAPTANEDTLLGWPDYQRGQVAIVFGTLFASPVRRKTGEWDIMSYKDPDSAYRLYRRQAEAYYELQDRHPDQFRLVASQADLKTVLAQVGGQHTPYPVGLVLSMEGADCIRKPSELEEWWELGVRLIGPAWAGTRYCGGTGEPGGLTEDGQTLLKEMAGMGFVLDISHMDIQAVRESLDLYPGAIIASHANAAACVPGYSGNRHLPDEAIRGLLERDGIIGVIPYCHFLKADWKKEDGHAGITLETLAGHIDHICQLAGDPFHVGLGSDFDGGFGLESVPEDVDTIADLQKLVPILAQRGYTQADITAILGGNWSRLLQENLPS